MNPLRDPLFLAIAAPLVTALALALGGSKRLAYFGFGLPALVSLWALVSFPCAPKGIAGYAFSMAANGYDTGLSGIGISLRLGLNGLSLPLYFMAGIVGLAAGLYAMQAKAERSNAYLALLLVMHAGLMGVFSSIDIFFFYFFHELALIPTFIMTGVWGGRDRNYAAMKMTVYLTLGAMLSLIGLIAIYVKTPSVTSFDLVTLRVALGMDPMAVASQTRIFGLLLFGFGILVSLWPLHTWAPLGYGAAPSSVSMLHAGVLKKFGLYGLIQVAIPLLPAGANSPVLLPTTWIPNFLLPAAWESGVATTWVTVLALLAVVGNLVIVGLVTIAQRDLKQMIGYSSVMHMGYAFLGIATLSTLGVGGVIMMMVAHGLSVALLFLLATCIHHRTQTFDFDSMGGLGRKAPVLAAFFVAATMASIGLPGFGNFWGELAIFTAAWPFSKLFTILALTGVVISAIYGLRAAAKVFFGAPTPAFEKVAAENPVTDLSWGERIPALILIAALFAIGFWPRLISDPINEVVGAKATAAACVANSSTPGSCTR